MNQNEFGCHSASGYALRSVAAVNTRQKSTLNNLFFCLDNPGHFTSSDYFADMHVAMDTMFVYGIDGTSRSNCLMHNLRCEGRRQDGQVTFYPPSDTLLYLMTTSLVHGSRGIHMRALNFTMMCGNGGGSTQEGTYRCPDLMLNWGPSVETTNPDMIGRLHNVVRMLTGKNTSNPDFMSALIDEDYAVLDTNEVQNAVLSDWQHATWNVDNNFIALEETESEDVLLLVVNDSSSPLDEEMENFIYFPNRYAFDYSIEHIAGFECPVSRSDPKLNLYYYGMPAYAASLYFLEYTGGF